MFARTAWQLLERNLPRVLRQPDDLDARGTTQLGAHLAGMAIETSMLGACHACANPLTAHYDITHGVAIGILMPHVVRFNAPVVGSLYGDLAHEAGMVNGDTGAAAESVARRFVDLMHSAGLPTRLADCGVSRGILPVLSEEANQQWTARFNPKPVTEAELLELYEAAF
jgi:alcohol dehydrogenase